MTFRAPLFSPARAAALGLVAFASLAACDRGAEEAPEPADEPAAPAEASAADEPAVAGVPCALTRAQVLIESVRLESEDGSCKLYLPSPPAAGEFTVRVSSAGGGNVAAVEAASDEGTLYATEGTVTVTSVDGRIVGSIAAEDAAPPALGRIAADFDVALPSP